MSLLSSILGSRAVVTGSSQATSAQLQANAGLTLPQMGHLNQQVMGQNPYWNTQPVYPGQCGIGAIGGMFGTAINSPLNPVPVRVDPLVFATETHMRQPSDKRWRRFMDAMFLVDNVMSISSEGTSRLVVRLRGEEDGFCFNFPFECSDPVQWFAEHVLDMEFPNNQPK